MKKYVTLKKNEDRRVRAGHLWVFSNELREITGEPQSGDIVGVRDNAGTLLGIGLYNAHSLIAIRLLSHQEEEISFQFFHDRITRALEIRHRLYPESSAYRVVHGEADFLPGLIVDRYGNQLVVQVFSYGMEKRLTLICDVLESLFHPDGIAERNETPIRLLEGLEQRKGVLRGKVLPVEICEHGIFYGIDLLEGQKTGFFLDQRENRATFRKYVKRSAVLDCFCNEGGFALNAAAAGASSVIGVDVSEGSVARAKANGERNKLTSGLEFVSADAFEYLKEASQRNLEFDAINLDPPSFAKNKKGVVRARRGYRELHAAAIGLLRPGGILATASCSHHISGETFLDIINRAAIEAGRSIQLLEWHGAAPDHPTLSAMPETAYLKFGIFRVG